MRTTTTNGWKLSTLKTFTTHFSHRSPAALKSPHSIRCSQRYALPRAVALDSSVAAAAKFLSNPVHSSETTPSSIQFTKFSMHHGSASSCGNRRSSMLSAAAAQASSVPTLVLIANPNRSRRKCRTPVKRTPVNRTPRSTKANRTSPGSKPPNSAPVKRTPPSAVSNRRSKSSRSKHRQTPKSAIATSVLSTPPNRPNKKYHRSVHETPNPERSHPRWERAKMAAAEKTKGKIIIVDESPIKPISCLGSPLRRLRRANSILGNSFLSEIKESTPHHLTAPLNTDSSRCTALETPQCEADTSCLSRTMSRAERWCRRQFEEELSLSQFTVQPNSISPNATVSSHLPSPLSISQSSGLLTRSAAGLCRHNSNLFANMISPEHIGSPGSLMSPINRIKTPRKNILLSPRSPRPRVRSPLCVTSIQSPTRLLTGSVCVPASARVRPAIKTPKTTPRRRVPVRRARRFSATSTDTLLDSPQVFDEEAMFLGRDEFLNETTNTASSVRSSSNGTDDGDPGLFSLFRKKQRISPSVDKSGAAPILRLNSTPKTTRGRVNHPPTHRQSFGTCKSPSRQPSKDVFPFLVKPECSPFAPLHVFNPPKASERNGAVITSDALLDSTTTVSSQSASNVVAFRTRLFGNSDSNETNSAGHDSRVSQTPRLPSSTPPRTPSAEHSRHPWDEASPDPPPSPNLRQLRRTAQLSPRSSPLASRKLHFQSLAASVTKSSIRPRRSLFQ